MFFITLLLISTLIVVLSQQHNDDCVAPAGPIENCFQIISSGCKNTTFVAGRLAYSDNCSSISIFWDTPTYNMTILFQSRLMKPYSICMKPAMCTKAYRTLDNGREVPIKWDAFGTESVCFKTERSDRPTMKFQFDAGNR
jgi:hypothetical protein